MLAAIIYLALVDRLNYINKSIEKRRSGVSVLFHAFSVDYLRGIISHKTARHAHTADYGIWLFTVLGQEDRAYECVLTKQYRYSPYYDRKIVKRSVLTKQYRHFQ